MLNFQWPWLIILLPVPFLIRYMWPVKKSEAPAAPEVYFPHLETVQNTFGKLSRSSQTPRKFWFWILFGIWTFSVLALMGPQKVDKLSSMPGEGHDLMLAVDLSGSMQSLDFSSSTEQVSRIDGAKKVVKDFLSKRVGDRVGLILFGGQAYMQAPLTLDRAAVSRMLDNALPGMAGDATAIGDAIGLAVKNLRTRPEASRAIILLTDGEDNSSTLPPLQAAELAKQYGIKIYTIVIGKDGPVPFPDDRGGYVMVESHVDTTLTREIAEKTGGQFYRATDPDMLAKIYDQIDSLQRSKSEPSLVLVRQPLFQYPLGVALLLIVIFGVTAGLKGESYDSVRI
ncbi:MAG TPA: VWA domain-containing protein [Bdellovibrio sp.]|uniref:vWA domain-containing protein n=1 Tax=Bdellovibrio sp. TaxID=28201 RepID=UPI002EF6DA5C